MDDSVANEGSRKIDGGAAKGKEGGRSGGEQLKDEHVAPVEEGEGDAHDAHNAAHHRDDDAMEPANLVLQVGPQIHS